MSRRISCAKRWFPSDAGSAVVEFSLLAVLTLVPLLALITTAFSVQRASFALTAAARESVRAIVLADSGSQGSARGRLMMRTVVTDQGLPASRVAFALRCSTRPCLSPGGSVRVDLRTSVRVVGLPRLFGRSVAVPVTATASAVVDQYRSVRP